MSSLVFPYSLHKGRSLPIIPVGISGSNRQWWKINAYLDSGLGLDLFDRYQTTFNNKKKIILMQKI